jgi:heptosyltransferase II
MNVNLIKFIDKYVGPGIIYPWYILSKFNKPKNNNIEKILIIKLWALGDSVITLVLIKALSILYPKSEISVLCQDRNKVIYLYNKNIKNIYYPKDILKMYNKFDLVFDCEPYLNISAIFAKYLGKKVIGFSHSHRSKLYYYKVKFNKAQHIIENYLDMIRILGHIYTTNHLEKVEINIELIRNVELLLEKERLNNIVGLTIGAAESATENRMWPISNFAVIGDYLIEKGFDVFFIGSLKEKTIIEKCRKLMKGKSYASYNHFNLTETIYLIENCSLFISNDTGPMHIAAAQGIKTIGLFGPNTPTLWSPFGINNIAIYHKQDCSPCINNSKGLMPKCKFNNKCMKEISIEDIKKEIKN